MIVAALVLSATALLVSLFAILGVVSVAAKLADVGKTSIRPEDFRR